MTQPRRYALRDRTILLVSPNEWGAMHVSKHHYALELAERGNRVIFLNPPRSGRGPPSSWRPAVSRS